MLSSILADGNGTVFSTTLVLYYSGVLNFRFKVNPYALRGICPLTLIIMDFYPTYSSRSGLVIARLPAAREGPGLNRAAGKSLCFHENHCDTQLWAQAAH